MKHDIAIVGAGIVGTTLAVGLHRAGFDVALVEAGHPAHYDPKSDYDLRVSALSVSSQRLLAKLEIWPDVARGRLSPFREMRVWDAGGQGILHFDAAALGLPELGFIVENTLVQSAAWEALDTVSVYCPARVAGLDVRADGCELRLVDQHSIESQLVIGADGADSRVRELAGIGTRGRSYTQRGIVCNVGTEKPHRETAWQRFLPTGPLAFLPLADGRCSIVWSADADEAEILAKLPDAEFRARLEEASGGELGAITTMTRRAAFPLRVLHAETYVKPRMALVGDAAHVIHPLAGQGVNLGLLDVAALVEVLGDARAEGRALGDERVLRRYERMRRADNLVMMAATDALQRLFGSANPLLRLIRNRGMSAVNAMTPLKNLFIRHAMGLSGDLPRLVRA